MNTALVNCILTRTHLKPAQLKPELCLAADIGFYGLDALSFMDDFFTTFGIENEPCILPLLFCDLLLKTTSLSTAGAAQNIKTISAC